MGTASGDEGGRAQNGTAASPGRRGLQLPPEAGSGEQGFFPVIPRRSVALLTPSVLVSSLQNCEAIDTCDLGHSLCGAWLWQP